MHESCLKKTLSKLKTEMTNMLIKNEKACIAYARKALKTDAENVQLLIEMEKMKAKMTNLESDNDHLRKENVKMREKADQVSNTEACGEMVKLMCYNTTLEAEVSNLVGFFYVCIRW